jgi:TusA-related sulfurtransferase
MEVLEREKEKVLDLSGLMCPLPIVITSENIKRLKEGEVITVISTDPGFERDIFNWCKQTGNQLLSLKKEGDKVIAQVKKGLHRN